MDRRSFLKTGAAAAVATTAVNIEAKPKAKTKKPNVLFLFSDQHRAFSLPGEPFNQAIAPNIGAFADANFAMEQCVSNYPLCSPYRGILMSGLYPQQSRLMGNEDKLSPTCGPLGETFKAAGYNTGYVGKWHINGNDSIGHEDSKFIPKGPMRMGFEDWHVWANTNDHWHSYTFNQETGEKVHPPEGWQPAFMTDEAITFMKAQSKDKPWFLILSWNPPHPAFDPPEEDQEPYPLDGIKFRPNLKVANGEQHKGVRNEAGLRKSARGYFGGITAIDKEFAKVLKALDETGMAEDTIVVYTSDHGEMMGSQGLMGKRVPYEESCRVPFIMRYPGVTVDHHKSDMLFAAVDIYPTLCGMAGVPVPKHCAGRDFSDHMRGRKVQEPEHVFLLSQPEAAGAHEAGPGQGVIYEPARPHKREVGVGHEAGGGVAEGAESACPPYRGIRTKTHTYVLGDTGRWLLFDNIKDPYQMNNLVADESQAPLMEQLNAKIEAWLHEMKDEFPAATAKKTVYGAS